MFFGKYPNLLLCNHFRKGQTLRTSLPLSLEPDIYPTTSPFTKDMHQQLGLGGMYPQKAAGRRKNVCTVDLVTDTAHAAVVMLRTTSKGQHHRRFSTGWREFCGRAGVEVGNKLVFTRLENANTLSVHVEKKAD